MTKNNQLSRRLVVAGSIGLAAVLIVLAVRAAILYTPTVEHNYADPVKGDVDAPVKLVEYSDFQCPYCKEFQPILKKVLSDFGDAVSLEYDDFPLIQTHPNSFLAAEAGQCALQQDAFWEYHDLLFKQQTEWSSLGDPTEKFVQYAKDVNLNAEQFSQCLNNHEQKGAVTEDIAEGNAQQVNSTPTLFVNGEEYDLQNGYEGQTGYAGLQTLIKKHLLTTTPEDQINSSNSNTNSADNSNVNNE